MANPAIEITNHAGIIDWLTFKGVITVSSFLFRVLVGVLIAICPSLILASLAVSIDPQGQSDVINLGLVLFGGTTFVLGFWIILATITKHYRTKGMYAPFLFALITPVMPFMLIVTWVFSSKKRRLQNEHLAKQQDALRKMARKKSRAKSIDEKSEPRYVGRSKMAKPAKKAEPSFRDKDVPTVRRRR